MPGKSRHKKGKHLPQSKKKKSRQRFSPPVVQHQAVAQTREPVSRPSVAAPSVSVLTPVAKLAVARYPHMATELRTSGILAGIGLIILVVLALVPLPW